jgi:hypothetical protein
MVRFTETCVPIMDPFNGSSPYVTQELFSDSPFGPFTLTSVVSLSMIDLIILHLFVTTVLLAKVECPCGHVFIPK